MAQWVNCHFHFRMPVLRINLSLWWCWQLIWLYFHRQVAPDKIYLQDMEPRHKILNVPRKINWPFIKTKMLSLNSSIFSSDYWNKFFLLIFRIVHYTALIIRFIYGIYLLVNASKFLFHFFILLLIFVKTRSCVNKRIAIVITYVQTFFIGNITNSYRMLIL